MEPAEEADVAAPFAKLSVQLQFGRTKFWLKHQDGGRLLDLEIYDALTNLDELEIVYGKRSVVELDQELVSRLLDIVADIQAALPSAPEIA